MAAELPSPPSPVRSRRPRWTAALAAVALTLALLTGAALGGFYHWYENGLRSPAAEVGFRAQPVAAGERVNVLLLGADQSGLRSDTIMVASFDPQTGDVGVLSIPRDTRVEIYTAGPKDLQGLAGTDLSRSRIDKINAATAYRSRELSGTARMQKTVEELLGVPIHYYARVSLDGLASLVDHLGGIDFDVPRRMNYDDPYQNLHIHLEKGPQHLNGKQVVQLVRFRGYYGQSPAQSDDLARIQVQQEVIRVIAEKMQSTGALANLPAIASDLASAVDTNLPASKLISLAFAGRNLSLEQVRTATLPGRPVGPAEGFDRDYYLPDLKAAAPLIEQLLIGPDPSGSGKVQI